MSPCLPSGAAAFAGGCTASAAARSGTHASRDDISYRERTESPTLPTAVALPCAGLAYAAASRPRAHGPAKSSEEVEHVFVDRGALVSGSQVCHETLWRSHADSRTPGAPADAAGEGSRFLRHLPVGHGGSHRRAGRWRLGVFARVRCRVRLRCCVFRHCGRAAHLGQALPHVLAHSCRGRGERQLLNL